MEPIKKITNICHLFGEVGKCVLFMFSSFWLLVFLGAFSGFIGILAGALSNWNIFEIGAKLVALCGIILSLRPIIRKGRNDWIKSQTEIDCGGFDPSPEELKEGQEQNYDLNAIVVGLIFALSGNLLEISMLVCRCFR